MRRFLLRIETVKDSKGATYRSVEALLFTNLIRQFAACTNADRVISFKFGDGSARCPETLVEGATDVRFEKVWSWQPGEERERSGEEQERE